MDTERRKTAAKAMILLLVYINLWIHIVLVILGSLLLGTITGMVVGILLYGIALYLVRRKIRQMGKQNAELLNQANQELPPGSGGMNSVMGYAYGTLRALSQIVIPFILIYFAMGIPTSILIVL